MRTKVELGSGVRVSGCPGITNGAGRLNQPKDPEC